MAISFYKGIHTYVAYAEDTAFGTAGTPTGTDYVDKVTTFNSTLTNNMIKIHGIGDGRNATGAVNGGLDCGGSMDWELTDPDFLQYCFVGVVSGSGTAADPYEIQEAEEIGYASGQVKTLTLETGSDGGANDDCMTYDGVCINSFTLNATKDDIVRVSADWVGRTVTSSTSILTYTGPTNRPFTFVDGSMTVGSDNVGKLVGVTLTGANNMYVYRTLGSRLINQPVAGIRRYDFSITIKLNYDDTASVLSGLEARGIFFSGVPAATTPIDAGENTAVPISLDLVEGASAGDRVVNFDLEECYFESYSEPIALEDGVIEITINGFGLSGLTDGAVKVPCRWWTIS